MNMKDVQFTPLEQRVLTQSNDADVTRSRRAMVVVSGLCFAAALVAVALIKRSWHAVLGIALVYIAITVWEKVAYANAVLAHKSVIRKLKNRVDEIDDQRKTEHST